MADEINKTEIDVQKILEQLTADEVRAIVNHQISIIAGKDLPPDEVLIEQLARVGFADDFDKAPGHVIIHKLEQARRQLNFLKPFLAALQLRLADAVKSAETYRTEYCRLRGSRIGAKSPLTVDDAGGCPEGCAVDGSPIDVITVKQQHAIILHQQEQITKLRDRLENNHAFVFNPETGASERIVMDLPESADGIACRDATISLMDEKINKYEAEVSRLREDCDQFYQVIGGLAQGEVFDSPSVQKALDNAQAASEGMPRKHEDLLPFIVPTSGQDSY